MQSVVEVLAAILLAAGLTPFGVETTFHRTSTRTGRTAVFLDHECISEAKTEPINGEATVAKLRSLVVSRNDHDRPEFLHETVPLTLGERW